MKKISITFKRQSKDTGLAGVCNPDPDVDIKLNKKVFGHIVAPNWRTKDNKWGICIAIIKTEPDNNLNCNWKNIILKIRFDTEDDARQWMVNNIEKILEKFQLHFFED